MERRNQLGVTLAAALAQVGLQAPAWAAASPGLCSSLTPQPFSFGDVLFALGAFSGPWSIWGQMLHLLLQKWAQLWFIP